MASFTREEEECMTWHYTRRKKPRKYGCTRAITDKYRRNLREIIKSAQKEKALDRKRQRDGYGKEHA